MRVTFIMEQHLGHTTYAQNLKHAVADDKRLTTRWVPVTYRGWTPRLLQHLPERLLGPWVGRKQIIAGIQQAHADILFFNTQVPAVLAGAQRHKAPYVIATDITPVQYDRMADTYKHPTDKFVLMRMWKHHVNTHIFRNAAHLFPWSHWVAASLVTDYGVSEDRITVLPPGVDTQWWQPGPPSSHQPLKILFVGGDFERKGGPIVLDAFMDLPPGSAELHLVTRSPVVPRPNVYVYHDMQPNSERLRALYQSADIFVLPSCGEAFGIAALEASATGLALVTTNVGGLRDIVVDQQTGRVVPPDDRQAFTRALHDLIRAPERVRAMGAMARERAVHLFDTHICGDRLVGRLLQLRGMQHQRAYL